MRGRLRAGAPVAAAVAACLAAGCSLHSASRRGPAEARGPEEVRIWMAPIVRWDAGGERVVAFALENATDRTVAIAAPDPADARVDVFEKAEPIRVCGVAPRPRPPAAERVELAPGDRVPVRVELAAACAGVPPGEYRYEVSYRAPEAAPPAAGGGGPAPRAISGTLATAYGELFVGAEAAPQPRAARRPPRAR